jgi:hypothetical protein
MLKNALPQQNSQISRERLFSAVQRLQPELTGEITGMLLEMIDLIITDIVAQVLLLLRTLDALVPKVYVAIEVPRQHRPDI